MFTDLDTSRRSAGLSSRIRRVPGAAHTWNIDAETQIPMPVIVDFVNIDPLTRAIEWYVEAVVDVIEGGPRLVKLSVESECGLNTEVLQREFRWHSPEAIVARGIPRLLAEGLDPFDFDLPTDGFPDAANVIHRAPNKLDDSFLEDIAREYLNTGRGYAAHIAAARHVSPRTVVSWVVKARERGILSTTAKGTFGGHIVPVSQRHNQAHNSRTP